VRLAHSMALENDNIRADCIEATEFPDLSTHYQVYAVPRTIINDTGVIEGSVPEERFLESVLRANGPKANDER